MRLWRFFFVVILLAVLATSDPAHDTALIAEYHLDELSGLIASDDSDHFLHGTLVNGPVWGQGRANGGLYFDGVNDYVDLGNAPEFNPASAISITAWIKPALVSRAQFIVAKDNLPAGNLQYFLRQQGTALRMGVRTSGDNFVTSPPVFTANNWYFVAGVFDGASMQLYVNGQPAGAPAAVSGVMSDNGVNARIGRRQDAALPFTGAIDEVSIYDRPLSAVEILTIYNGVVFDSTAPSVSITAPAQGALIAGTVLVTADAADNVGVAGVQFQADGVNIGGEDTSFPYSASLDTTALANGAHTLTALVRDTAGLTASSTAIAVNVDNGIPDIAPPQVQMTTSFPATVSNIIPLTADATDDVAVASVTFEVDGRAVGADNLAPYLVDLDTRTLANGPHTVRAIARDSANNSSVSAPASFVVDNLAGDATPPVLSNGRPSGALAAGITQVQLTVDTNEVADCRYGTIPDVAYGNMANAFSVTGALAHSTAVTGLAGGQTHNFYVRCVDPVGNATPADFVISFDIAAPLASARALYRLDEASGLSTLDSSGNGNHGILVNGPAWTSGRGGSALQFDGVNDYVDIGNAPSLNAAGAITIAAWVRPALLNRAQFVVAKDNLPSGQLQYFLRLQGNAVRMGVRTTIDNFITSPPALVLNTWQHVAGVYDGGKMQIYVNGQPAGAPVNANGTMTDNGVSARIGRRQDAALPFQGVIDDVEIYDRALNAAEIQGLFLQPSQDITAPQVSVISPVTGAQLSGTYPLSATASDNIGVAAVQFIVDGADFGAEVSAAPYTLALLSANLADGTHTIAARARDAAGNTTTSAPVNITVNNNPAMIGQVSAPLAMPAVAVHASLLHTNEVLFWAGQFNGGTSAHIWRLADNSFVSVPNNFANIFCAGHSTLADGRLLVVGGHDNLHGILGERSASLYDPVTRQWTQLSPMAYRRWYGTATSLPDGRVLISGGGTDCFTCYADIPEIFDPATNSFTELTNARLGVPFYMQMVLLPDGRLVNAGSDEYLVPTQALDLSTQTWSMVAANPVMGGSVAMYRMGEILKAGTPTASPNSLAVASADASVLDMNQPVPSWRAVAPMNYPRFFHTLTVLPDGNVVVAGGSRVASASQTQHAVHEVEMWSPQNETWSVMARIQTPRLYHSTSLLLPDGRVMISGSGASVGPDQTSAEIYSPPYLFRGPRPVISNAPAFAGYGSSFDVETPQAAQITRVTIIRLGSATHNFDMGQRFVELQYQSQSGRLQVTAPADGRIAPPGYYMLFILDASGVPSISKFIRLGP